MPLKTAEAVWNGSLADGRGRLKTQSGALDVDYGWKSRAGDAAGTNPEELVGAALAGCFSMALSHALGEAGHTPERIQTRAEVKFDKTEGGFSITGIRLLLKASVPGADAAKLREIAEKAKTGCPVSKALTGTKIELQIE